MKKALITVFSLGILAAMLGLQLSFMRELSVYSLLLLDLTVIALLALVYLVGKSLLKLMAERRQRALGYRFKTRVVAIFLVLTSIPAGLLFLGSSGLGTNYIERLFSAQYREPIERSVKLAQAFYDMERSRALRYARLARSGGGSVAGSPVAGSPEAYYRVQRFDALTGGASTAVRAAFLGREESEVISGPESDTIRAAVPLDAKRPEGGILVVESSVPPAITKSLNDIKASYEDYIKLESWRTPLKLNYLLLLGLLTMLIIFSSLWFSLRISGWITEPVRSLASATEAVAAGDLSVRVTTRRQDEMGLLIDSFNRMVSEIKDGRESLEKAYFESDRRRLTMENILDNIQSGVISLDGDGRLLTINQSAVNILGLGLERPSTGIHYAQVMSSIKSPELQDFIGGINIHTLKSIDRQLRVSIDGRRLDLRVFVSSLRSATGQYLGLLVVFDDLTDVISAQKAIAWQEVARRIAHEIKNPLTPIKLSAERMLKKWREGDRDFGGSFLRSAETIVREADGMKRLLDEFSRFGRMPLIRKSPSDIRAIVDEVCALYGDNLSIKVEAPPGEEIPLAGLDAEQLRRALINLFDNALDAMGGGGKLTVSITARPGANRIAIEVADEGPGIKDEDKERLFQPYFSTKTDDRGLGPQRERGLGLAIAERIIAEHGGNIRVSDNVPRGTVFTIELPIN